MSSFGECSKHHYYKTEAHFCDNFTKQFFFGQCIAELGLKYRKTHAKIIMCRHTRMGFAVIQGSKNVAHIRDNPDILDFRLTAAMLNRFAERHPEYEKA